MTLPGPPPSLVQKGKAGTCHRVWEEDVRDSQRGLVVSCVVKTGPATWAAGWCRDNEGVRKHLPDMVMGPLV